MAESLVIPVSNLLIDTENPRLSKPNGGQREALRELAEDQQGKLLKLAQHIVANGPNQSDLPIVMPAADRRRYIVLEGNRRLAALKGLENPDSLSGALFAPLLSSFRHLSSLYEQNPVESLNCLIVKDRDEARPWIELRHTGQNEGAGIVPWNANETGRYRARSGVVEPHLQALDYLEDHGLLSHSDRKKVPTASLKRLISTPLVREKLGIDVKEKQLVFLGSEGKVAKALLYVAKQLADGKTKTEHIYKKEDREKFANELPGSIVVPIKKQPGSATAANAKKKPRPKPAKPRDQLIRRDCVLNVSDPRIEQIEIELRIRGSSRSRSSFES